MSDQPEALHPAELRHFIAAREHLLEVQREPMAALKAIEQLIVEKYSIDFAAGDKLHLEDGRIERAAKPEAAAA